MGIFQALAQNEESAEMCRITRVVRYCRICRKDFHEGEAIKETVRKAVNLPPALKSFSNPTLLFKPKDEFSD